MILFAGYRPGMEGESETRKAKTGLGGRLKAARQSAKLTQTQAGDALGVKKATVSSWEIENNVPDAITLGKLAKLYGTTADSLLWDDSISMDAIRVAVAYDSLNEAQRRTFDAVAMAFTTQAKSDQEVEEGFRRAAAERGGSLPAREKFLNPMVPAKGEEHEK